MRRDRKSHRVRGGLAGLCATLMGLCLVSPATATPFFVVEAGEREADYCKSWRVAGFEAPPSAEFELACEAGKEGELAIKEANFESAHRALSRALSHWELPVGHLLMAMVEANLGRSLEALTHVWLAARHDGRGLKRGELELLALMEKHILERELGQVSVVLERGETLELEGLFAATGPIRSELLLTPGPTRLVIRVGGREARREVVQVRPGRRIAFGRDGTRADEPRDPRAAPVLAVARTGFLVNLRTLVHAEETRERARSGSTTGDRTSEACRGFVGDDEALCLALEAERLRFKQRLVAIEKRNNQLETRLREFTR